MLRCYAKKRSRPTLSSPTLSMMASRPRLSSFSRIWRSSSRLHWLSRFASWRVNVGGPANTWGRLPRLRADVEAVLPAGLCVSPVTGSRAYRLGRTDSSLWSKSASNTQLTWHSAFLRLTLWRPLLPYEYSYRHPVPDRVKTSFVIFDIQALWRSGLSVRVPGCQKLQMTA